jgi:hypothetical protein
VQSPVVSAAYQPRQRADLGCSGGGPTSRVDYFRSRRPVWGLLGGLGNWRRTQPRSAFHRPLGVSVSVSGGSTRPAAMPSASAAIMRAASVSGRRNVLVQVSPCHNETTATPSEGWADTLIRRSGVRGSLNQTRRGIGIRPASVIARMIAHRRVLGQRFFESGGPSAGLERGPVAWL